MQIIENNIIAVKFRRVLHKAAAMLAVASVASSCSHETISSDLGVCRLSPSVSVDASVKAPDGSVVDGTTLGFVPEASELSFTLASPYRRL